MLKSNNMNVLGIVAEYNPFHFGHKYHLEVSKKITESHYSIAVISGSFVQRGEPSLVDKWTKAKMAIDNGVDLVIEIPFIFATQSAELFAYGSVSLLDKLNIVDYLVFGSEFDEINTLNLIAETLVEEPPYYKDNLKKYLSMGYSYPVSCSNALQDFFVKYNHESINSFIIEKILNSPNSILSIEYLKSLIRLNSKIKPIPIKRIGSQYKETELNHKIASATSIRKKLLIDSNLDNIKDYIPDETYANLLEYLNTYKDFNSLCNYNQIIHYLLKIEGTRISNILDIEPGLDNRIIDKSKQFYNIEDLIDSISTKRYTKSRIRRILIHLMMGLEKDVFYELIDHHPAYIRVLASNENGFKLLNKIKEKSELPIIIKYSDYKKNENIYIEDIISFDKKATDLYFLGLKTDKPFVDMDYYTSPYMKNSK